MNRFLRISALCLIGLLPILALANDDDRLKIGPLTLDIHISKTAHLFHVVDQISQWSEFCHDQYVSYFEGLKGGISKQDQDLLTQHRTIREKHGWGSGLEQTFYTTLDLDAAIALGVKEGNLSQQEAETERRVLAHFQGRVERLMAEESSTLRHFVQRLQEKRSEMVAFANNTSHFVGGANLTIPVYLMANPHERNCGGGFNGGRLTLEIAKNYDMYPTLLHELFHAFLKTKQERIVSAANSAPGLNSETLSEGLAYAFNPGLIQSSDSGQTDQLLSAVADDVARGSSLSDSYTRFNAYGLALRPLLKDALFDKRQTLDVFLPRATDAWLVLTELDKTRGNTRMHDYAKDPKHSIFVFGILDQIGWKMLQQSKRHLFQRPHHANDYMEMLTKNAKPGDSIILLLSLDDPSRVPAEFSDLMPLSWPETERFLKQGQTVFRQGKVRDMEVFLIAAPTGDRLHEEFRRFAGEHKFIPDAETKTTIQTPDSHEMPRHHVFVFGSMGAGGVDMLRKSDPNVSNVSGHSHDTAKFEELLKNAKPGDTILLLLSSETARRMPEEFAELMFLSWPEIDDLLKKGQIAFKQGKARNMNVFLLVTPTTEGTQREFQRLAAEGKFAPDK